MPSKTISEHLQQRRADRIARAIYTGAMACLAICLVAFTVGVVVKTARIVADTEARCASGEAICAGPEW